MLPVYCFHQQGPCPPSLSSPVLRDCTRIKLARPGWVSLHPSKALSRLCPSTPFSTVPHLYLLNSLPLALHSGITLGLQGPYGALETCPDGLRAPWTLPALPIFLSPLAHTQGRELAEWGPHSSMRNLGPCLKPRPASQWLGVISSHLEPDAHRMGRPHTAAPCHPPTGQSLLLQGHQR